FAFVILRLRRRCCLMATPSPWRFALGRFYTRRISRFFPRRLKSGGAAKDTLLSAVVCGFNLLIPLVQFLKLLVYLFEMGVHCGVLTHMSHDVDYDTVNGLLPKNVLLGFDGFKIVV